MKRLTLTLSLSKGAGGGSHFFNSLLVRFEADLDRLDPTSDPAAEGLLVVVQEPWQELVNG